MRTIRNLPDGTPYEESDNFPDGAILNDTDTEPGTPVVREIYNDVLANLYKILRLTGVIANGQEDSEGSSYQLVQGFQKLANTMNDAEQTLNLNGTVFSLALDLGILPNKYFCFARAAEAYDSSGVVYTFKGNGAGGQQYSFISAGFASGDELLIIIDSATVRAYNVSAIAGTAVGAAQKFTPFGTPLAYSDDSQKTWYQQDGLLFSDAPEAYDLQAAVRTQSGDGTLLVYEMFLIAGNLVCLAFSQANTTYNFFQFSITALTVAIPMTVTGGAFSVGNDFRPFVYTDGTKVYVTNSTGNNANDYDLDIYTLNLAGNTMALNSSVAVDAAFEKTTNAVLANNCIYTFIGGILRQYNLATGMATYAASFPGFIGVLFRIGADIWYTNGEVATKWTLRVY